MIRRNEVDFCSPIGDPIPQTSDTEVLDHMLDSTGINVTQRILHEIDEGKRRIFPMGPPGVGKTTFAQQLAREINRSRPQIEGVGILYFDDALASFERQMGPRSNWTSEWSALSAAHLKAIDDSVQKLGPNYILIAEMVGVGITDRDVTAFETLALRQDPQDLFIPFVADPRIQQRAYEIRRAIKQQKPGGEYLVSDQDLQGFLTSNNLLITGTNGMSNEEIGKKIREIMSRMDKMLIPLTLDTENEEDEILGRQKSTVSVENLPSGESRLPELTEVYLQQSEQSHSSSTATFNPAIPIQVYESGLNTVEILAIETLVEYYERKKNELQLPRTSFMTLYNLLLEGKEIHYLDLGKFK